MKKVLWSFIPALLLLVVLSACNLFMPAASKATEQTGTIPVPEAKNSAKSSDVITSSLPEGMPSVETDFGKFLGILQGGKFLYITNLAVEKYDASAYSAPGTLTFNAAFPATETVYLYYGWCAKDTATLQQNLEHIQLSFQFNDQQIPNEYVTTVNTQTNDDLECANAGMLLSNWTPGIHRFRVTAGFDETINDGFSVYGAGNYIADYTVAVQ